MGIHCASSFPNLSSTTICTEGRDHDQIISTRTLNSKLWQYSSDICRGPRGMS